MNKKWIYLLTGLLFLGGVAVVIYQRGGHSHREEAEISHYTCPMHPHVHEKEPGECPICHMKLVPVFKESDSSDMSDRSDGITISPDRQQTIGITTAKVGIKPAVREIQAPGRVAFDPELAVAQAEYLEIANGVPNLEPAAHNRLKLLGMGEEEVRELRRRNEPDPALTLPKEGGSVWIYAPLYGMDATTVKVGQTASMTFPGNEGVYEGIVRGISPVLDSTTRSARVRIEVPGVGGKVLPESFLNVSIKIDLGEQILVPKSSLVETGTRSLVFVVHDGTHFSAREVTAGPETAGERVIEEGLKEGEVVATSAVFLIDSESQLKAAVEGVGGHQH
ncbi:MAG: efflux RND transporter periplasmic adaptor subunit [Deltaproteobacteria bacterium]|nr:efflux RND transporter periplasmic adaptor subunit [Deltaproteobacteria bacterium]